MGSAVDDSGFRIQELRIRGSRNFGGLKAQACLG